MTEEEPTESSMNESVNLAKPRSQQCKTLNYNSRVGDEEALSVFRIVEDADPFSASASPASALRLPSNVRKRLVQVASSRIYGERPPESPKLSVACCHRRSESQPPTDRLTESLRDVVLVDEGVGLLFVISGGGALPLNH